MTDSRRRQYTAVMKFVLIFLCVANVAEIESAETRVRQYKREQCFDAARNGLAGARSLWTSRLGIPRPSCSPDELRQLDCGKIQALEVRARRFQREQWFDAARNEMAKAQSLWTSGLRIPRPSFSPEELLQLDLGQMVKLASLARQQLEDQFMESAKRAMSRAESLWRPELDVPRPGFSESELQQIRLGSIQQDVSRLSLDQLNRRIVVLEVECGICIDIMAIGDSEVVGPNCCHCFHTLCMEKWLLQHRNCPLCRSPWF